MKQSANAPAPRKAVFLDRDGVINRKLPETQYVTKASEFHFLPGVGEALSIFKDLGFLLVLITNQRGIARGLMTGDDLDAVHDYMQRELGKEYAHLDAIYHCPHEEFEYCNCRKPEPGMILAARTDLNIDLASSYMVGDSVCDMSAGQGAGVRTICIGPEKHEGSDMIFPNLLAFARFLRAQAEELDGRAQIGDAEEKRRAK
jgi:D-glycero-D-manno-heptose 1,7-bisphosphate phosphatase